MANPDKSSHVISMLNGFTPDMGLLRSVFSKLNNTLGGLVEVGFEYVTGECNDGGKLLRKRK